MVIHKPPWALRDILNCFKRYWFPVFSMVFTRSLGQNVDRLIKSLFYSSEVTIPLLMDISSDVSDLLKEASKREQYGKSVMPMSKSVQSIRELCWDLKEKKITPEDVGRVDEYLTKQTKTKSKPKADALFGKDDDDMFPSAEPKAKPVEKKKPAGAVSLYPGGANPLGKKKEAEPQTKTKSKPKADALFGEDDDDMFPSADPKAKPVEKKKPAGAVSLYPGGANPLGKKKEAEPQEEEPKQQQQPPRLVWRSSCLFDEEGMFDNEGEDPDVDICSKSPAKSAAPEVKNLYVVLDTNVIIKDLKFVVFLKDQFINGFGKPTLAVPWIVFQELDRLKDSRKSNFTSMSTEYKARKGVRYLRRCFENEQMIGQTPQEAQAAAVEFMAENNDDRVIQACLQCQQNNADAEVVLLCNDNNLITKAIVCGVQAFNTAGLLSGLQKCREQRLKSLMLRTSMKEMTNAFARMSIE